MDIAEKRDSHNNNNQTQGVADNSLVDREAEDRERQARDLKAGLHPLKHKLVFWYTRRTPGVRTQTPYEDSMKRLVDFSTVEGFWV